MNYYIIELMGERGTHHTVKIVFTSMEKAESYAKNNCSYIHHGLHEPLEKVTSKTIAKLKLV